jgi:serine/threonine protein phosphatase PrpC
MFGNASIVIGYCVAVERRILRCEALILSMAVEFENVRPGVEVASLTDVGRQRLNNEDSYLYWEPEAEKEFQRKGRLALIADGMGGYEGGQEASRLAVETVRHVYDGEFPDDPQAALLAGFAAAHEGIQRFAMEHPELHGMGTTCTAFAVVGAQLYFAHVGDSRLYRVRGSEVTRLTRDHSYVGRLVESGIVRAEDAESHPQRHILTAALGSGREVVPDAPASAVPVLKNDSFVLCTDGLWGLVGEQELAELVNASAPQAACQGLVRVALERGGPDNITVIIVRILE